MANSTEVINKRIMDQYGTQTFPQKRTGGSDLSKDAFLNLLTTQLRYQNPLEPTNDKEFLAQMAQFTALEQMNNLYSSFQFSQASSMINKNVVAEVKNEESGDISQVVGKVVAVNVKENKQFLLVQSLDGKTKEVELSKVKSINDGTTLDAEILAKEIEKLQLSQANSMINKNVEAELTNDKGEVIKIGGKVVAVNVKEGKKILLIKEADGKQTEVELSKVKVINDGTSTDGEALLKEIEKLTQKVAELEKIIKELKQP